MESDLVSSADMPYTDRGKRNAALRAAYLENGYSLSEIGKAAGSHDLCVEHTNQLFLVPRPYTSCE